ncbi:MAG: hypothetical protein HQK97_06310 [Nitrospirae bacterium]|nr:hypothetical protein [Nitrospirota bacterium]
MMKISDDLKHIGAFVGRCFGGLSADDVERQIKSAVAVHKSLDESDSQVENIGHVVGSASKKKDSLNSGCFGGLSGDDCERQIESAVPVLKTIEELDSHVNNIGRIVDNVARRASDFLTCAAMNIEDSFNTIGKYISVEHMPPSPCCVMGRALYYLLQDHLDGSSNHPSSCSYHT